MTRNEVNYLKLSQIDDTRRKRAVIILLAAILYISVKGFLSPVEGVGFVLQKEVIGIDRDERVVIFQSSPEGILIKDLAFGHLIPEGSENLQINESMEIELNRAYPEIEYVVSMRLCVEDEVREYRTSREDFNSLDIGTVAKFRVYRSERDVIEKIVET